MVIPEALYPYKEIADSLVSQNADMTSSEYCLYDLNGDNIPELWINSGKCGADKKI